MKYYFYLYLIINTSVLIGIDNSSYKINHLEPPSWWTGMIDSSLQLMVHGENISDLEPSIKYPGVIISSVQKLKNPNYLFIDLFFLETVEPGSFEIIFKKNLKN